MAGTVAAAGHALADVERHVNPLDLDADHRWTTARQLLHDTTIDTEDRLAGLLLLLYAQGLSAISQLTVDQITITDDSVHISFGHTPIRLPEPIDGLARTVVAKGPPGRPAGWRPDRGGGEHRHGS
ncbi:hypothetical protein ACFY4C_39335 [Actinomadura viridis]|uniref:hypothetical protein n=1 Tax=Actinomadura viridis TaxID=58110 RepID=UPI003682FC89